MPVQSLLKLFICVILVTEKATVYDSHPFYTHKTSESVSPCTIGGNRFHQDRNLFVLTLLSKKNMFPVLHIKCQQKQAKFMLLE